MKPAIRLQPQLSQKLTQKLTLSPKVLLAMRLTAKNRLETKQYIDEKLESNLMLELASETVEFDSVAHDQDSERDPAQSVDRGEAVDSASDSFNDPELDFESEHSPYADDVDQFTGRDFDDDSRGNRETAATHNSLDDSDFESDQARTDPSDSDDADHFRHSDVLSRASSGPTEQPPDYDAFIAHPAESGMRHHLTQKVNEAGFTETEEAIALAIVHSIEDDGYLRDSMTCLQAALAPEYRVDSDEIESVLRVIQSFEPAGLGARNLQERLLAQLWASESKQDDQRVARALVEHHLQDLAERSAASLARATPFTKKQIENALALIRTLDPDPAAMFFNEAEAYILPEARILPVADGWHIALHKDLAPDLRISETNRAALKKARGKERELLREHLKEARELIGALEARNQTFRDVLRILVEQQSEFLRYGERKIKVLLQKDVAEAIGMAESTISRTVASKYVETPRGTIPLQSFFCRGVPMENGEMVAVAAVKARITDLIRREDPLEPLSDELLTELLARDGIPLSRRGVAKYRGQLSIPNSSKRKRQARSMMCVN